VSKQGCTLSLSDNQEPSLQWCPIAHPANRNSDDLGTIGQRPAPASRKGRGGNSLESFKHC
jgi:hypothetical protein